MKIIKCQHVLTSKVCDFNCCILRALLALKKGMQSLDQLVQKKLSRTFKLARVLIFITGIFPFSVGTYFYIYHILHKEFNFIEHIAYTNLIATGGTICVLSYFELEKKKVWVIVHLLFLLIWVAGNDAYALIRNYFYGTGTFPFALFPSALGILSLILLSWDLLNE